MIEEPLDGKMKDEERLSSQGPKFPISHTYFLCLKHKQPTKEVAAVAREVERVAVVAAKVVERAAAVVAAIMATM